MRCEWDAEKSDANFEERGFDFAFATLIFAGPIVVVEDRRRDYGERRFGGDRDRGWFSSHRCVH